MVSQRRLGRVCRCAVLGLIAPCDNLVSGHIFYAVSAEAVSVDPSRICRRHCFPPHRPRYIRFAARDQEEAARSQGCLD